MQKMVLPIELRAYVISVVIFAILFFTHMVLSNSAINSTTDLEAFVDTFMPWINATVLILYVVAGLVSSLIAKRRVIFNGAIAGILAAIVAIVIFGVAGGDLFGIIITIVTGGVLGGIGGACTLISPGRKSKAD